MKKKRLLGILLSITLILGLTPGVCMTVRADNEYAIWVKGIQVTDANKGDVLGDGTVSFTPAVGETPATLTLNGANLITYIRHHRRKALRNTDFIIPTVQAANTSGYQMNRG